MRPPTCRQGLDEPVGTLTVPGERTRWDASTAAGLPLRLLLTLTGLVAVVLGGPASVEGQPVNLSSASNQTFVVGSGPVAISTKTISSGGGGNLITAADATGDIRIRIPAGFNMTWDTTNTTAVLGGSPGITTKVSSTVIYEDAGKTLVLDVLANFTSTEFVTVSGLSFANFTAASPAANLELNIHNTTAVDDTDDKTITIIAIAPGPYTFVVNDTGNQSDATVDGICDSTAAGVQCTLRAAIEEANAIPGLDTIRFNIGAGGLQTISTNANLPAITDPVIIDATTQPGYGGTPIIQLSSSGAGPSAGFILDPAGSGSTIRGLIINLFTGGGGTAIRVQSSNNVIAGNYLGTNPTGTVAQGNKVGVFVQGSNNRIGGTTGADRNVVSGNTVDGIQIDGSSGAIANVVQGNYIGLNAAGTGDLGNTNQGVAVFGGATNNTIGGTAAGAGNVISGNNGIGVAIASAGSTGNVVQGNLIGTNAAGTAAIGNSMQGVAITGGAAGNTIGGATIAARNVISGNGTSGGTSGLLIRDANTASNIVAGNFIGTTAAGTAGLGNVPDGVRIGAGATNNTIGGTTAGAGNVISGNSRDGVVILDAGTTGTLVQGNMIGTNPSGTAAIGNVRFGVLVGLAASSNTIGGTAAGAGNVVSGNLSGVQLSGPGVSGNVVAGNLIGTNAAGTAVVPNSSNGIEISAGATSNTIGGTTASARNVISGNSSDGVLVNDANTNNNVIAGNFIGTNATGTAALANGGNGIIVFNLSPSNNTIGGTAAGAGNLIAFNSTNGIQMNTGTGNGILGNAIHSNTALGIDLVGDGVTANDVGDADTGPNNRQNYPVVSGVSTDGVASVSITGSLNSAASTTYRIEFFANTAADPSGFGEGQRFLGFTNVTTDAGGNASIGVTLAATVAVGEFVSATATDPAANTSEFSGGPAASPGVDLSVTKTVVPVYPTAVPVGGPVTYTLTVRNNSSSASATNVKVIDTMPPGIFYSSAGGGPFNCTPPPASVVTCTLTLPSLAPLTQQSFQIVGQATAPGVQTNSARPTANEADSDSTNDEGTADTLVTVPGTAVLFPTARSSGVAASIDPANQNFLEWLNPGGPATQIAIHRTTAPGLAPCPYETNSANLGTRIHTRVFVANQKESFLDSGLTNLTTYCYTIFVDGASPRFISGRPFDAINGGAHWAFNMGTWSMTPPGNGSGMVHAVSNDNVLYAMTKGVSGGKWPGPAPQWLPFGFMAAPSQGRPSTYPLPAGAAPSVVFLTSQDGKLYAVNAQMGSGGSPAWPPSPLGTAAQAHPSAIFKAFGGAEDLIFAASRENPPTASRFFALRLSDGTTAAPGWSQAGGGANGQIGPVHGQPAVDYFTSPPKVYFATRAFGASPDNNTLWCLNALTGAVLWAKAYGDIDAGVSLRGNRLYVATNSGTVLAVDTTSGNPAWTVSGPLVVTPAAEGPAKGFVYAPRGSNELFFATKGHIWFLSDGPTAYTDNWPGGIPVDSPATPIKVPGDTLIYVGSGDGTLQRRNAATGAIVDAYALGDFSAAVGSPTFDLSNNLIYVGTEAGIVYVLHTPSAPLCFSSCTGKPAGTLCSSTAPAGCGVCTCDGFGTCVGGC